MKQNEGSTDRLIRIVLGSIFIVIGLFMLAGFWQVIVIVLGIVLIGTGIVGYCGLYTLLGITTCPMKTPETKVENN